MKCTKNEKISNVVKFKMSFRHTLRNYSFLTVRPIDVNASYRNNLSGLNPFKFKEKLSHFDRYEKRKTHKV